MKARGRSALAKLSVPLVWRYGRDLTDDARRGRLDPVIGREEELTRLIQILGRKTKNNPVLIGKSGVGKTAIVEGLARRIAEGAVPRHCRASGWFRSILPRCWRERGSGANSRSG